MGQHVGRSGVLALLLKGETSMAERMMTYLKPGKTDVLGDRWASQVRELYDKALARLGIPKIGDGMGAV